MELLMIVAALAFLWYAFGRKTNVEQVVEPVVLKPAEKLDADLTAVRDLRKVADFLETRGLGAQAKPMIDGLSALVVSAKAKE
jgi:hypothetical protein